MNLERPLSMPEESVIFRKPGYTGGLLLFNLKKRRMNGWLFPH